MSLSKKKRTRTGNKASATQMLCGLLADTTPDPSKLSQLKLSLQEKLETLKLLDSSLVDEIKQADAFKESIYAAMINIDQEDLYGFTCHTTCTHGYYFWDNSHCTRRLRETGEDDIAPL